MCSSSYIWGFLMLCCAALLGLRQRWEDSGRHDPRFKRKTLQWSKITCYSLHLLEVIEWWFFQQQTDFRKECSVVFSSYFSLKLFGNEIIFVHFLSTSSRMETATLMSKSWKLCYETFTRKTRRWEVDNVSGIIVNALQLSCVSVHTVNLHHTALCSSLNISYGIWAIIQFLCHHFCS